MIISKKNIFVLVLLVSFLSGCSQKKEESDAPIKIRDTVYSPDGPIPYPHPPSFLQTRLHGEYYSFSKGECAKCHDLDPKSEKNTCNNCHGNFPHDTSVSEDHGKLYIADKTRTACYGCHSNGDKNNTQAHSGKIKSCRACHEQFPHVVGWAAGVKHGQTLRKLGEASPGAKSKLGDKMRKIAKKECFICHEKKLEESGLKGMQCYTCHIAMPHLKGFVDPKRSDDIGTHHGYEVDVKGLGECYRCHKTDVTLTDIPAKHERVPNEPVIIDAKFCGDCHHAGQEQ